MNFKIFFIGFVLTFCLPVQSFCQSEMDKQDSDSILFEVCDLYLDNYNPILLLNASNSLVSLSKEQLIDSIRTVNSSCNENASAFGFLVLLRLAFDLPDSVDYPEIIWGIPDVPVGDLAENKDRFPILMVDGFPILLPGGYILNGLPDNLDRHITFYEKYGTVRNEKFNLNCDCTLTELTNSLDHSWKAYYDRAMTPSEEARYTSQLKLIVNSK